MTILAAFWPSLLSGATDVWNYVLLAIGFGFVIFFHELGHFLAAKYAGVKVEQFAVGFGPAIVAWRKGVGFRSGTTTPEYERRINAFLESQSHELQFKDGVSTATAQQIDGAMAELGLSETEYRLNWIPLGGYVKMLGQDDLRPGGVADDPRAYNNKPIRSRMLIVSAGVVMNVILAAIGFMIVFMMGLKKVPPAVVGGVISASPATFATDEHGSRHPLAVGDRILYIDGEYQHDFTKVRMNIALSEEGKSLPILVEHRDGSSETLHVTPARIESDSQSFLQMGIAPPSELQGLDPSEKVEEDLANLDLYPADSARIKPGDVITAVNGTPVVPPNKHGNYWMLDDAMINSDGRPIDLTVRGPDQKERHEQVMPHFQDMFQQNEELNFAGMVPRAAVRAITEESPARGQLHPADVIEAITNDQTKGIVTNPSRKALTDWLRTAGDTKQKVVLTIHAPGDAKPHDTEPMVPSLDIGNGRHGLGILLRCEELGTVVSEVQPNSPADKAHIEKGWRITRVDGQAVSNWFQVRHVLAAARAGQPIAIEAQAGDAARNTQMVLTQEQIDAVKFLTFTHDLTLHEMTEVRKAKTALQAAGWGITETRDFILQFYITIRRMATGSVSPRQAMGPVGIFRYGAKFAGRGNDWLIWFLAMISANLAVVNFLPIPVVDGGQFVFLVLEKIQGRPLSQNTQKIIQVVGLALILGVFILVTYQDIARIFGKA